MKRARFPEEPIIGVLREHEAASFAQQAILGVARSMGSIVACDKRSGSVGAP
jgi:hypothetical protein